MLIETDQIAGRIENVGRDLWKIALRMRLEGLSQDEAYEIIELAKVAVTGNKVYGDDPKDDAIVDILDGVVGWCMPSCHIWSPNFDAKKALSELEANKQVTVIDQTDPSDSSSTGPSGTSGADSGPSSVT